MNVQDHNGKEKEKERKGKGKEKERESCMRGKDFIPLVILGESTMRNITK